MSLRTWLTPVLSHHWLARDRLLKARDKAERARVAQQQAHQVHYFHQVDDPYSALVAECLPAFVQRYGIELHGHVVGAPLDAAAPDREKLVAYSRKDAQLLAERWGLAFRDSGRQPPPQAVADTSSRLVAAAEQGRFVEAAGPLSAALWTATGKSSPSVSTEPAPLAASPQQTAAHLAASEALRNRWGHYLGATFFYAGEWYWGLDRLHHLEQRLQDLGVQQPGVQGLLFPPAADLTQAVSLRNPPPIDFYFSLRSPYSAIVAPRVFELGRLTGAPVRLRYVLPMVMRGLAVPRAKRQYIALDAAREAHARGVPFGRLNDPVGRPVERGLALMPLAEREGQGPAYVLSFLHGVWAEGLDAGSDRGLRRIAERAGLRWPDAQAALKDEAWRQTAEANRVALSALGLWGVPSFHVRCDAVEVAVWGQDRLWAVQNALLLRSTSIPATGPSSFC